MLFTPVTIGPLVLKNRAVRAAAFEGMCPNHNVSDALIRYHRSIASGGIGMSTVAYAAINKSALSFNHQLWIRPEIKKDLIRLTDAIHAENAAASIQLGHCGNMAKRSVTGIRPVSASAKINWYGPTFPREASINDIKNIILDFGKATQLAGESGFDAVEIHAGHGYLISQFLSPYTNKRSDEYGGSLQNRMRFMKEVMQEVLKAAGNKTAVIVKMNMRDGFDGGMPINESLEVAATLQELGVHALVLSGGFVSKTPMYVMRGAMPIDSLAEGIQDRIEKFFVRYFGKYLIKEMPFTENYFLEDAKLFRKTLSMPLIYVGGILSEKNIEDALAEGFDAVAIARALISNPNFINNILEKKLATSDCNTCNQCIAKMYSGPFKCEFNHALD